MPQGDPGAPFKTLLQNFISIYISYLKISEQSVQWLLRNRPEKMGGFLHAQGGDYKSTILNFETVLHNLISISIIFPNFKAIRQVVTEKLFGKNWAAERII